MPASAKHWGHWPPGLLVLTAMLIFIFDCSYFCLCYHTCKETKLCVCLLEHKRTSSGIIFFPNQNIVKAPFSLNRDRRQWSTTKHHSCADKESANVAGSFCLYRKEEKHSAASFRRRNTRNLKRDAHVIFYADNATSSIFTLNARRVSYVFSLLLFPTQCFLAFLFYLFIAITF